MANINDLRRYAGVLPDGDTTTLAACMAAAEIYLQNAGVGAERMQDDPLYDIAVYMLATHFFDQRGLVDTSTGKAAEIPYGVTVLINQLRF